MTGTLILIAGHAGVGKSTLATAVCENTRGWVPLDKDTAVGPLSSAAMTAITGNPDDRDSAGYVQRVRPAEYEAFQGTAILAASYGATVVATAPWVAQLSDPKWVADLEFDTRFAGITLAGIWVACDEEEHLERIGKRSARRDRGKQMDLGRWHRSLTTPTLPAWMHVLDNTQRRTDVDKAHAVLALMPYDITIGG